MAQKISPLSEIRRRARELRNQMTPAEWKIWEHLSRRQIEGIKFRRQHPIGSYIVDFYSSELKLIIEVDGGTHLEQQVYDAIRTKELEHKGYKVIRFNNQEIDQNLGEVIDTIQSVCVRKIGKIKKRE